LDMGATRRDRTWAYAVLAGSLLVFYAGYLPHPGSLYARVVREFWPLYHTWPYYELSKRIFASGHLPLWNHLNAGGTPLLGCFQAAPFHPARMAMYLFPFWKVVDLWLLLRVFISGVGVYRFLRWRGVGWQGAVFSACAWMYSGVVTDYVNVHYLDVDLLLPWGLLAFGWMAGSAKLMPVLACAFVVFLAFLGGNPTSSLYFLIFLTLYYFCTVYRTRRDVFRSWLRFAAAAATSGLIAAAVLLPFWEMLAFSWNYHPAGLWSAGLEPRFALSLFGPEVFPAGEAPGLPLVQRAPYIGTVVLTLVFAGFFYLRRMGAGASFFAAFGVFLAGVIWGVMPFNLVNYLPLLVRTANFRYAMPEAAFCAALLAGMSWHHLIHFRERPYPIVALPAGLTFITALLAAFKGFGTPIIPLNIVGALEICAFAWAAALIMLFHRRGAFRFRMAFFMILALWLLEAFAHFNYYPPARPEEPGSWKKAPRVAAKLGGGRIYAVGPVLYPNANLAHGLEDLRYFGALYVDRYREFMSVLNDQTPTEALADFLPRNYIRVKPEKVESRLMNLAGVNRLLSETPLPPNALVDKVLDEGSVRAPAPEYVLKKKTAIRSDVRVALFEHPPARVTSGLPGGRLSFGIGIEKAGWVGGSDGVVFIILEQTPDGPRCIFLRHINPSRTKWERWWMDYGIEIGPGRYSFVTHPGENYRNDWAAWGDIRVVRGEKAARFKLAGMGDVRVYENPDALPRAFTVGKVRVESRERAFDLLKKGFDFTDEAILEGKGAYRARMGLKNVGKKVEWRRLASDEEVLETDRRSATVAVITETYYPGWRAYMDGREELKIHPADGMFRAVSVPEGKHRVRFVYEPVSFKIGLWCGVVSLAVMALLYDGSKKGRGAGKGR